MRDSSPFMEKLTKRKACAPPTKEEPYVYFDADGFHFGRSFSEVKKHGQHLYNSPKRYIDRAYVREGKIHLPFASSWESSPEGSIELTETFVRSVILHIEKALKKGYANVINLSDMGHSHLFYPPELEEKTKGLSAKESFSILLRQPEVKILYHTAEQIDLHFEKETFFDNPILQFRYFTRNILGDNRAQGELEVLFHFGKPYNTVRDLEGHKYGYGFYLHASKGACFPYKYQGKEFFFDLSYSYPPRKENSLDFQ